MNESRYTIEPFDPEQDLAPEGSEHDCDGVPQDEEEDNGEQ